MNCNRDKSVCIIYMCMGSFNWMSDNIICLYVSFIAKVSVYEWVCIFVWKYIKMSEHMLWHDCGYNLSSSGSSILGNCIYGWHCS